MDIELYGLINSKLKGKASLVNGKVPADQLPSYVDDVINGYYHDDKFYEEDTYQTEIPAEEGKIYVDLATNNTYRWSGLAYIQIGGLEVIANPTLAGTEAELAGLQIGDTKYKLDYLPISGGTMNGSIIFNNSSGIKLNGVNTAIRDNLNNNLLRAASTVYIGTSEKPLDFITNNTNITHTKSGLIYNVLDSSNTKANPTLDGTEDDLTGLQVDGTKYKVPSGGGSSVELYQHNLSFNQGNARFYLSPIYTNNDTPLTKDDLMSFLQTNTGTAGQTPIPVPSCVDIGGGLIRPAISVKYANEYTIQIRYLTTDNTINSYNYGISNITVKDSIIKIL